MTQDSLLEVGFVARAHGLRGELGVRPFDRDSTALLEVERVHVRPRTGAPRDLEVLSARHAVKDVLMVFKGVESRNDAEALVGSAVFVPREELAPPNEGEFFQGDLVGMSAFDPTGTALGTVAEIWNTGPVPNLVIRSPGRAELVVPFVDDFVPEVDLASRRLTVKPPEYLE
ncbi:MAG TPA: ribosome maturation factor RimM [Myxococcaceae bacterium]|nr:ribosome maturation factor RimM [Myxococcaceae bacterium]